MLDDASYSDFVYLQRNAELTRLFYELQLPFIFDENKSIINLPIYGKLDKARSVSLGAETQPHCRDQAVRKGPRSLASLAGLCTTESQVKSWRQ